MREYTSGCVLAFISELGAMPTFVRDVYAERTAKDARNVFKRKTFSWLPHILMQRIEHISCVGRSEYHVVVHD